MNYATALVSLPLVCESSGGRISTPEEALGACKDLAMLAQESFHALSLTTKNRLINRHMVSLGTINSAPVGIADCFRGAISDSAASVILAHNHCSGDTAPSAEDIAVTKRLVEAGRIVGIRVVDHIIVGRDPDTGAPVHLSLRERGLCQFE
jgi:DNA repair protein RadC